MAKVNISQQTAAARHARILALLRDRGDVRTSYLEQELGVTAMTVWRDLRVLEELGQLRRVHGGARLPADTEAEPDFERKSVSRLAAKRAIATCAAEHFVHEGDVIGLEGGTTVAALVPELPERRVSVLTNSLLVAGELRTRRPALPVRLIGGWVSPVSGNTTGPEALKTTRGCRLSVCFLSATAWAPGIGPMDPNPLEIEVKRALAETASKVVLLMDAEKFGARSSAVTLHPRRLHALVTDREPPVWLRRELEVAGVALWIAQT